MSCRVCGPAAPTEVSDRACAARLVRVDPAAAPPELGHGILL